VGFDQKEAELLLTNTGRRCCICGQLHHVQLHHIVAVEKGGTDEIDNAIPLCPNCHNEVHTPYAAGRTTKVYTPDELRLHRQRTIEQVRNEVTWAHGNALWQQDKNLLLFYAQCLDRPAFRTRFHQELSFSAFDKAMEDTLIAFSTGYWSTRDGRLIERAKGKVHIVHPPWRTKIDRIVEIIEGVRRRFRDAVGFNRMLYEYHSTYTHDLEFWQRMAVRFRSDANLGDWMDAQRQDAIDIMNSILEEVGHQSLPGINQL